MDEKYKGQNIVNTTEITRGEDGFYTVIMKIKQQRSEDLETWEEKEVSLKVLDTDDQKAYAQAIMYMNEYIKQYDFDLFKMPDKELDTNDETKDIQDQ
jgi:hypothetical protein